MRNVVSRFFRVQVDRRALVDAYFAYITDPRPTRNEIHTSVLDEGPIPPDVLEQMVIEGVDQRRHVAALVDYCLETGWGQQTEAAGGRPVSRRRVGGGSQATRSGRGV